MADQRKLLERHFVTEWWISGGIVKVTLPRTVTASTTATAVVSTYQTGLEINGPKVVEKPWK